MDELDLFDVEDSYDDFDDDFYDDFDDDDFDEDWFDEDDDFNFEMADASPGYSKADIVAMEHLAELAMDAESDEEEDAFIGALASIASKALPLAKKLVPKLAQAGKKIFDQARKSPAVQSAIKTAPSILRKVALDQAKRVAAGQPVNLNSTLRSASKHTRSMMNNPRRRKTTVARHNQMVRQRPVPQQGIRYARGNRPSLRRRRLQRARSI
ncbi:MAG: hypothetical protein ACR2RE_11075 [Geminicoccaceae bacterium]